MENIMENTWKISENNKNEMFGIDLGWSGGCLGIMFGGFSKKFENCPCSNDQKTFNIH